MLTDNQLIKYSRQIMLPQIDIVGQEKLKDSHVVIVGLGGLGSPVAMYLAPAGIGQLTLIDDDQVDESNLQRQIIHTENSVGKSKVASAKETIEALDSNCSVQTIDKRLNEEELKVLLSDANVLVDCCDNFETRFLLNRVCFKTKKPLVSGSAIRWEGQLTTFTMEENTPCYQCLYDDSSSADQTCSQNGVVGPVVGIIGSMQALEAIKVITGARELCVGELTLFDGLDMSFHKIKYSKKDGCPVCNPSID
ncbi:MAG: molybdopterin-synthase adenylyltransferase MoeB [Kangiellaceae bacterium]|nr:molybdopterin-synthase adenylyltransferase MoeB [Kangiellaceae bacterium]